MVAGRYGGGDGVGEERVKEDGQGEWEDQHQAQQGERPGALLWDGCGLFQDLGYAQELQLLWCNLHHIGLLIDCPTPRPFLNVN